MTLSLSAVAGSAAIPRRKLLLAVVIVTCAMATPAMSIGADQGEFARAFPDEIRPLLEKHCYRCHNGDKHEGEIDLTKYTSLDEIQRDFQTWRVLLQLVEDREMPPEEPLLGEKDFESLTGWIKKALHEIDWSKLGDSGRVTLPRLTKEEYNNSVRDLLGIDFQPKRFLLDDGQGVSGFTNDRDSLFIPPALAEQYFDAAKFALDATVAANESPKVLDLEAESLIMTERGSKPEELPGGGTGYVLSSGQRTLFQEAVATRPGWYRFSVKAVGVGGKSRLRLRIDNEVAGDFEVAEDQPEVQSLEVLLTEGTHQMTWNIELPQRFIEIQRQARKAVQKGKAQKKSLTEDEINEQVTKSTAKYAPQFKPDKAVDSVIRLSIDKLNQAMIGLQRPIERLKVIGREADEIEVRRFLGLITERVPSFVEAKELVANKLGVTVQDIDNALRKQNGARLRRNEEIIDQSLEAIGAPPDSRFWWRATTLPPRPKVGSPGLDWIRIEGPIVPNNADTKTWETLFDGSENECIERFLVRAFRRPLRDGESDRYLGLYNDAARRGESRVAALQLVYAAALISPQFLFRDEAAANDGELNDYQIASRLSYFLWMTAPDEELMELARSGKLKDKSILRQQALRMVADAKFRASSTEFIGQWLGTSVLGTTHVPDTLKFTLFDRELAESMKLEPVLVFEDLVRHGGSLLELLDSHDSFINSRLAMHYGVDAVGGNEWKRVSIEGTGRGGLLGMGGVLTASSTPNRTSPVIRGKWILETLLGRTLAEPPADAGQLDDKAGESRGKTLREELAEHRRNAQCATCHDKLDPLGFALENFDAIGRFREFEAKKPVDSRGALPNGIEFEGATKLRALLLEHYRDEFVSNVVRRLSAFALGRALRPEDEGWISEIVSAVEQSNYRADALVQAIVVSEPFLKQKPLE